MESTKLMKSGRVSISTANFCKPVESDAKNWFSTGCVMFENENWKLGDPFLVPIVRLTDERVKKGFTRWDHCDASIVEKYIGEGIPANLEYFVKGDTDIVEGIEVINVDEWAEYANEKIMLGLDEIQHNSITHDSTLGQSLVLRVKTKITNDPDGDYSLQIGITNSSRQKSKVTFTI